MVAKCNGASFEVIIVVIIAEWHERQEIGKYILKSVSKDRSQIRSRRFFTI